MGLIPTVAHFKLCSGCGRHGCIVDREGDETVEFFSQEMGLVLAEALLSVRAVSRDEYGIIIEQIAKSSLVKDATDEEVLSIRETLREEFEELGDITNIIGHLNPN